MLALIRHGQTDWNLDGLMQGRTDIPLNDTGREQALVAASALSGERWDAVVSSPLVRARETAELIATALGVPLGGSYDELVEQDFGAAEGTPVSELDVRWPDARLRRQGARRGGRSRAACAASSGSPATTTAPGCSSSRTAR